MIPTVYDRILGYVKASDPGNRRFHLSEQDMHDLLTTERTGADLMNDTDELDRLFPGRHDW